MAYNHLTFEECNARYPRLAFFLRCQGILSHGEAGCAIRDYRMGKGHPAYAKSDILRYGGGEAVSHYGGPLRLLQDAIRNRHMWAKTYKRV